MPKKQSRSKRDAHFSADRPIVSARADNLGRRTFAEGLAKRIQGWKGRDSLVISLCGEWGCGKTSLKNMVIEKLRRGSSSKVDFFEFNPWEISGHDSLASTFFRELAFALGPTGNVESPTNGTAGKLKLYAKLASFGGSAIKVAATAFGMNGSLYAPVLSAVGEVATQSAEAAERGAEAGEAAAPQQQQSLVELKRSLAKDMAKLSRPLLIVIDDIDRLTTDEIREVFQLVKANADFPNLIYLLMFDREIVSGALDTISGNRGDEFLDKIVQVLLHVPQPSSKDVRKVLFDGLNIHLADASVGGRWENSRWGEVWPGSLSNYFPNLRCVYRFLGSFGFHVSQMRSSKAFELNPIDLVALETLRLFEPSLYEALPASRDILAGNRMSYLDENEKKKRAQAVLDGLLSLASKEHREGLRDLLNELFPILRGRGFVDDDTLARQLRVGHESFFDRYFTLSLASDDVSEVDMNALRDNFTNLESFARICASLNKRGQLEIAFQRLDAYKQSLPKTVFPNLITTLIEVGDSLPEEDGRDFFSFDAIVLAWRLIYFGLKSITDESERFAHLKTGLSESRGIRLAVQLLTTEERRTDSSHDFLISEEHWSELKPIVTERFRVAAKDGRLKAMRNLSFLLWRWLEWTGEQEVRDWISTQLRTGNDALWVLRTFLSTSRCESNKVTFVRYVNLETLERFSSVETLTAMTASLETAGLEQDNFRALRAFRQALIWKAEGKPASYHGDSWHGDNPLEEDS